MKTTTLSSREFNQDRGRAKRAAKSGPVFITDRGRPSFVLLSIDQYNSITCKRQNIMDMLALPGVESIEFEIPRTGDEFPIAAEFE